MKTVLKISLAALLMLVPLAHAQQVTRGPGGALNFSTTNTAIDTGTLTNTNMVGLLTGTPTAAATYTSPTAAQLCTYMRPIVPATLTNYSWVWIVKNTSAGANTITVAGGSGMTLSGTGTAAQNTVRLFRVILTNCTSGSEAGTLLSLSTGAF
jgi:hypothetical protein